MIIDFDIIGRMINKTLDRKGFPESKIEIDNCKFYDATDLSGGNAYIQVDYIVIDQRKSLEGLYTMGYASAIFPIVRRRRYNMNIKVSDYLTTLRDYKLVDILK